MQTDFVFQEKARPGIGRAFLPYLGISLLIHGFAISFLDGKEGGKGDVFAPAGGKPARLAVTFRSQTLKSQPQSGGDKSEQPMAFGSPVAEAKLAAPDSTEANRTNTSGEPGVLASRFTVSLSRIFTVEEIDTPPRLPEELSARQTALLPQGQPIRMNVELLVDEAGRVVQVDVEGAVLSPETLKQLKELYQRTRLSPGKKAGAAVSVRMTVRVAIDPPLSSYWRDHGAQRIVPP